MKYFFGILVTAVALFYMLTLLKYAIHQHEQVECTKWQEYDMTFDDFEYSDWQKEQCGVDEATTTEPISQLEEGVIWRNDLQVYNLYPR